MSMNAGIPFKGYTLFLLFKGGICMNELIKKETIEKKIYEIRGMQVMLDSDLAEIYQCANGTKTINQAVKRNNERFPEDFYFQLNKDEYEIICGPNLGPQSRKARTLPYAFTEQGVAMLATIIKTNVAAKTSINIMRAFVNMRHYINYNGDLLPNRILLLEKKTDENTKRINELFDKFDPKEIVKDKIFFEGEFYDAYSLLLDILNKARKEIIIIDNYASKELFDVLKDINIKILVISKNIDSKLKKKYESQYNNITFINNDSFHDRFIIIDKKKLYSCGSSFKDIGKKCFYIGKLDNTYIDDILDVINI